MLQNPKRLNDPDFCTERISWDFIFCMCRVKKLSIKKWKSKMKQLATEFKTYHLFVCSFCLFVLKLSGTFPCERWWVTNSCSCCLRSKRQWLRWELQQLLVVNSSGIIFYNPDFGKRETPTQNQNNWGARTESILEWPKGFRCATASQV